MGNLIKESCTDRVEVGWDLVKVWKVVRMIKVRSADDDFTILVIFEGLGESQNDSTPQLHRGMVGRTESLKYFNRVIND